MKKILLLLSMFVLFACEQEDLNGLVDESKAEVGQQAAVGSRAASTIADFNPITELDGIQVNILNMGTIPYKYLSCVEKGNKVDLYDRDDGSMRQRWYISNKQWGSIKLVGGSKTYADIDSYIISETNGDETYPVLCGIKQPSIGMLPSCGTFQWINDDLVIGITSTIGALFPDTYLQPKSINSSTLQYKKGNNDMSTHWRIDLVGDDYEFEKTQYVKAAGDYINLQAPMLRQYEYYNMGKPEPGEATFQLNETIEYTSTFQESQTVSISNKISTGVSVSVPTVVSGNLSSETTTSYGWSFTTTNTQRKSISITDTYKYIVPPNKDVQMNIYCFVWHDSNLCDDCTPQT